MLAEAQQFFAFLRETDVLELRKTWKEFIDALLEHMARSFFCVSVVLHEIMHVSNRSDNIILI